MRHSRRAVALLVVLLLSAILFVLALALGYRQVEQRRQSNQAVDGQRAYQLALSGLEAARIRLDKDPDYPPNGMDQDRFSATEMIYGPDQTTVEGTFILEIDSRWRQAPYRRLIVTSTGCWPNSTQPQTRRQIRAEWNLQTSTFTSWRDLGSP